MFYNLKGSIVTMLQSAWCDHESFGKAMTFWMVLKVAGSLVALAYGLYATMVDFHKEHEGKRPLSRNGKIGIAILVMASTLAIVADFGDKTSASAEKARAQKAQDAVTAEQLSRLTGLASGLQTAQRTTAAISSDMQSALHELTRNTQSVGKVLTQSERALEPLRNMYFRGSIKLDQNDAEISQFMANTRKSTIAHQGNILLVDGVRRMWEGPGPPGFNLQFDKLREAPTLSHFGIAKGSTLYPKAGTPLALIAQSLLIVLHFSATKLDLGSSIPSLFKKPDLAIEFVATPDDLTNFLGFTPNGDPAVTFAQNVAYSNWVSNGVILSVRDLLRAQAVVEPVFGLVMQNDHKALDIWKSIALNYLTVSTGDGRSFRFDTKSTLRLDGIPIFVGHFVEGK
ncbi:MAG: hypothetical protein ABI759_28660 [Candidatus Solibacter sp.]